MACVTWEERTAQLKTTDLYKKLEAGNFSFRTALSRVKEEVYRATPSFDVKPELKMAAEVAFNLLYHYGYENRPRYANVDFRRDVIARLYARTSDKTPDEQTLRSFVKLIKLCNIAHRANTRFQRYKNKPVVEFSSAQAHRYLREHRNAQIIYDCGVNVIAPLRHYGGVACGFLTQDTLNNLLHRNIIDQDVYFNADGRKSYSLWYKGKSHELPSYLRGVGLPGTYLSACGVR